MESSQEQKNIGYFLIKSKEKFEVIPFNSTKKWFVKKYVGK